MTWSAAHEKNILVTALFGILLKRQIIALKMIKVGCNGKIIIANKLIHLLSASFIVVMFMFVAQFLCVHIFLEFSQLSHVNVLASFSVNLQQTLEQPSSILKDERTFLKINLKKLFCGFPRSQFCAVFNE